MPIKTIHITNYYHKNSGGISTAYNALLAAAERHKRYMAMIVPGEKEEVEVLSEYTKIFYVPARKSPVFDKRYRVMMPWDYMPVGSIIRRILMEEMPDMIEIRDKYSLSMFGAMVRKGKFKELNRPMLISFSSERMDDNVGFFLAEGKLATWFARRVMGNYNFPSFDYHLTNSTYTAEEFYLSTKDEHNPKRMNRFTNWCWKFFRSPRVGVEDRVVICPTGVDAENFSPERKSDKVREQMCEQANIPKDSVILLYAGRISPEKNVGLLVDFMEVLTEETDKDYRLLVAGAGPKVEWLKEQTAEKMPGKIVLLGHLDKETLADYYATADVFVHPNPKEPFGIAPLEAMASGVPTVVPNSGGLLFYATNENTWLCEPTGENFANAIKEIIHDPELRAKKIEKAHEAVQNNTRYKSTDNMLATFDRLHADFKKRNELFTDQEASKDFDFKEFLK